MQAVMAKSEETPRALLLKGDDDFQKDRALDEIVRSMVSEDFADFDLERMEGDNATSDRIIAGLSVPPMGSERRVVLVRHAQKITKEEQEKLAARLEAIPKSGCLILVNPAVERVAGKAPKGSEVIGDLSKAVRKAGQVREIGGGQKTDKTNKARAFVQSLFAEAGKKADGAAVSAIVQRVGFDFAVLKTEVDKVTAYVGDAEKVAAADVNAVTCETPEEKIFKLVDAIAARNPALAMRSLNELFETGGKPDAEAPRTLSNIARIFRLIWQMKLLQEAGVREMRKAAVADEIKRQLPSNPNLLDVVTRQSWQQDKIARQAAGFTRAQLSRCFLSIARADRMLKGIEGGIEDPVAVMELLVIDLASGDRGHSDRASIRPEPRPTQR